MDQDILHVIVSVYEMPYRSEKQAGFSEALAF